MLFLWEFVQGHVVFTNVQGPLGTVQAVHLCSSCFHGINAESSRVAEHIEDFLSVGKRSKERAVFSLIQEESSLLAFFPIDVEAVAMLYGEMAVGGLSPQPTVFARLPTVFAQRFGTLVVDAHQSLA